MPAPTQCPPLVCAWETSRPSRVLSSVTGSVTGSASVTGSDGFGSGLVRHGLAVTGLLALASSRTMSLRSAGSIVDSSMIACASCSRDRPRTSAQFAPRRSVPSRMSLSPDPSDTNLSDQKGRSPRVRSGRRNDRCGPGAFDRGHVPGGADGLGVWRLVGATPASGGKRRC